MKRIAIFCVTYNSYGELQTYYQSLQESLKETELCDVDFFVADNTEAEYKSISLEASVHMHPHVFAYHKNLGYFGAIHQMMTETEPSKYDYVILSNVDVMVGKQALDSLCKVDSANQLGWIAPQIYSLKEKRDLNPAIMNRYTKNRLMALRLLYKYPLLLWLYENTLYKRKKIGSNVAKSIGGEIYAGHGSFIILTKEYIQECGIINYPIFLYDEELYLAEECRSHGLKVVHEPSIIIEDIGKVSTGKMPSYFYCKCNEEGINYIINKYY